jgi:tetratricopeptide (TPR) repeat protein
MRYLVILSFLFAVSMAESATNITGSCSNGILLMDKKEYSAAADVLSRCLKADPSDTGLLLNYGKALFELKKYDEAILQLTRGCELKPGSSLMHQWLGRVLGRKTQASPVFLQPGLAKKTIKEFEKAVDLDPSNLEARMDCLHYYREAPEFLGGGKQKARMMAQEIAKRDPEMGRTAKKLLE